MRSNRVAPALTLTLAIASLWGTGVSAHRRDEYLQAARIGIAPRDVRIELDLTPGIAVADGVIAEIDRDRNGSLNGLEQQAYVDAVTGALIVTLDGVPLDLHVERSTFPDVEAMRRGEDAIRIEATAAFAESRSGTHHLQFRNAHHPDSSVYLANALVPEDEAVEVTGQQRDGDQTTLTIDYIVRPAAAALVWPALLFGTGAAALCLVLVRVSRPRARSAQLGARA